MELECVWYQCLSPLLVLMVQFDQFADCDLCSCFWKLLSLLDMDDVTEIKLLWFHLSIEQGG